jgi:mitochondrial fission protein ELM1
LDEEAILRLFKQAVQERQVKISLHAAEEALAENITRTEIETVLLNAQILEDYPDWWLGPSCLIYGRTETERDLHLVASYSELPITIITVYEPRPPKWLTPTQRGGNTS